MNIHPQKRMASEILKCGIHRYYMNPESIDDVQMAITREDIRNLIKNGIIRKRQKIGISRVRALKHIRETLERTFVWIRKSERQ